MLPILAPSMNATRTLRRRSIIRCLNAPPGPRPRQQYRHLSSHKPLPRSKAEAESLLKDKGSRRPELENVSLHRAEAMRRAYYIRRRNWLALGAALSMIAPMIIVRFWPMPQENKDTPAEDSNHNLPKTEPDSKIGNLIRPTQCDSPQSATETFQGKKVVVGPRDKILAAPETSEDPKGTDIDTIELIPTGTSYVPYFPKTISLPNSNLTAPESAAASTAEYTLLGLGIRKVSFLKVQVYIVGLYIKTSSLSTLQNHLINTINPSASALIPDEKGALRSSLLDPDKSSQIWETILSKKGTEAVEMAWRVVPARGTDFKHLQDGWMRGVASRTDEVKRKQQDLLRQQAVQEKRIALPQPVEQNEFDDESFGLAMKDFKALFQGRGKAPKGSVIALTRDKDGVLGALYQPLTKTNRGEKLGDIVNLGEVRDERVGRLVWLLYLGGKNVSSEDARKDIVDGCVRIVERPVGTVEGMVQ
ncbi:uncharacterized protein BDR25DRAFT_299996 [Lindgomyces ingoldianus]|uniref:Uncharacterized protein n=1 Tax=Lindgomyces ingoldianus TaxID=673940 RepID=A0ACB6RDN0_9PLEO|nr:uncharacterized protein BDR25DRAFT_299996 [Lindgomyces ingoldianus]KAF2476830.1 hypothetical protein BDR25DRAFT_299996 [Lindgomyces ingoldianus]